MKQVYLIAAMESQSRAIGIRGRLPWHIPADLKHFKALTLGRDCIVGYKTWRHMPVLDGRNVIVAPREFDPVTSLEELISQCQGPVMILGGADTYRRAMPFATHMWLTLIGQTLKPGEADTFFPEFDWDQWNILEQRFPEEAPRISFIHLEKKPCMA